MTPPTVIIPSRTSSNLIPCLDAVRRHEPHVRVIVIDDGLPDRSIIDAITIDGVSPFVFARNCNIGIRAAGEDADVVLLNDDAILETPDGLTLMQRAAIENPEYGIISATSNLSGNPLMYRSRKSSGLREAKGPHPMNMLPFICVLIPARTRRLLQGAMILTPENHRYDYLTNGLLDERYTTYAWEDVDYCRQVREAGLKLGIFDGCYVDHGSLRSTFRGDPKAPGAIDEGRKIYLEKWGSL